MIHRMTPAQLAEFNRINTSTIRISVASIGISTLAIIVAIVVVLS